MRIAKKDVPGAAARQIEDFGDATGYGKIGGEYFSLASGTDLVKCSVALSADTKEELLDAVIQHGTTVHGYEDTSEFREKIVTEFKEGTPPA